MVVLPVAAIEQHGPHLPVSTDRIIGEGIVEAACQAAASDVPLLLLPTLALGTSSEHQAFTGTLTLDPATLETTLFDICLLYTSPSPRDGLLSRMPSSA